MSDLSRTFLLMLRGWTFLSLFFFSFYASAQVIVTPATGGESICPNSGYYPLGDIIITEQANSDINNDNGKDNTIEISFSNPIFEFDLGGVAPTVSVTGVGINSSSILVNSAAYVVVTINFSNTASSEINVITISGLRVRATASGSGDIIRSDALGIAWALWIDGLQHDPIPVPNPGPACQGLGSLSALVPPVANISNDKSSLICPGENITFTGGPAVGIANYEFILDPSGARASLQSSSSEIFSSSTVADNDEIAVIVTDGNGCTDESVGQVIAHRPPLLVSITNDSGGDDNICTNELITFTVAPAGAVNYEFYTDPTGSNPSLIHSGPSEVFTTSSLVSGYVNVVVTDVNGCTESFDGPWITVSGGFNTTLTSDDADNIICDGTLVTFTASDDSPSVDPPDEEYEFFVNGLSVQGPSTTATYATSTLINGDEIYVVTNDFACKSTSNTITNTISPVSDLNITAAPNPINSGDPVNITIESSEPGINYELQDNSNSNSLSNVFAGDGSDLLMTSNTTFTSGVTIKVVATNVALACSATMDDVMVITVTGGGGGPAAPTASDPAPICVGGTIPTLTAVGTNLQWYSDAGLTTNIGSGSPFTPVNPDVDENVAGTYTLYVTQNTGTESVATEVDVEVVTLSNNSLVVSPAASTICENSSVTITVQSAENNVNYQLLNTVGDVPMSLTYVADGSDLNLITNAPIASDVNIKVRATNASGCVTDLTNTATITVDQMPSLADAGSNINQCSNGDFVMAAVAPVVGTGTWSISSGVATITPGEENSINANITGVPAGTNSRWNWAVSNGVCPNSVDDVLLRNRTQPTADAGPPSTDECDLTYDFSAILDGAGNTGLWTLETAGPGTPVFTNPDKVNGSVIVDAYGQYVFRWIETNNNCVSSDDITVNFYEQPTADIATTGPVNVCAFTVDLAATPYDYAAAPSINSGSSTWSFTGPGNVTFNGADPTNPNQTGLVVDTYGAYVFTWKESNGAGTCTDSKDITVNFNPLPVASAGSDESICEGGIFDLTSSATSPGASNYSTLTWTTIGTGSFNDATVLYPIYTPGVGEIGTTTLTLTANGQAGACAGETAISPMTLTINPAPVASAGPDQEQCNSAAFTLAGNNPAVGSGLWTIQGPANGAVITTPIAFNSGVTGLTAGSSVTLRWTISSAGCTDSYDEVILTNSAPPSVAVAGGDIAQCDNSIFFMGATVPAVGTGIWSEVGGPSGITITNASSATTTVTGLAAGSTATLRWTVSNGICADNTDDLIITNNESSTVSVAGPDQEQCNSGTFTLAGNNPAVGIGLWTIEGVANGAVITTPMAFNSDVTGLTGGSSVTLRWTISSPGCSDRYDEVTLTNTSIPILDAGATAETCEDAAYTVADASVSNGTGISWTHDGNGSIFNAATLNPIYLPVATDAGSTVTLTMTVGGNGSCGSEVDTKALTITEAPAAYAGANSATCEDAPYTISDAVVSNASSTLWSHNGFGSIIGSATLTPTYQPVAADGGNTVTLTLTATGYGSCTVVTSEKILQINAIPAFTITNNPGEPATISSGESTDIDVQIASGGNVMLSDVRTSSTALSGYSTVGTIYPDGFKLQDELINSSNNTEWIEYDFTASAGGCVNAVMQTVRVIVNPAPHMLITNHNPTICSGETANIDLSSLTVNAVIELASVSISPDAGSVTGITSVGTDWDSGLAELPAAVIDNLVNSTNNIQTVTYEFVVSAPGFASTSTQLVQVIVNPTAFLSVTNTNTTINSGAVTDILLNTPTENGTITLLSVSKTDPLLIGNTLPGASFPNGTRLEDVLLNSSFSPQDITYEFQVSANGCVNASTFSTSVTVSPAPEMSLVNNIPEFCSGGSADIVVNSVTSDATIELINVSISPNATGITGFTAVGSIWTSAALELPVLITDNLTNSTNDIQTITYEFEVSASGYTGTNLLIAEVTVNPTPDMTITNTKATINSGAATEILINSSTENGQIAIKNLVKTDPALIGNTAVGTLFTDGARLEDVLLNSTPSAQIITYMFEARGNGCINPSLVSTDVTVNPAPEMTVTNNILSICPGEITDIDVSSVTTDAFIELIDVSINPNTSGITGYTPVGTTWEANLSEIPFTIGDNLVNNTDTIQTITYEFEVSASGFTSTLTQTAVIEVNPMPSQLITNSNTTINSGLTTDILIQTSTENGQIALKSITKTDPALIGNTGVGTLFPNDTRIEDVLLNTSISPQMITYEFEATANGCANPGTIIANVTVNPAPAMTLTNNSPTICSEETIYIEANSSTVNSIIELKSIAIFPNAAGVAGYTAVGTTWESNLSELPVIITDALVNNTNSIQTITYEFEVTAGGFTSSTTVTTDVVVNPTPALTIANSGMTINSGSATNILINTPTQNGMVNLKSVSKTDPVLVGNSAAGVSFADGAILVDVLLNSTYDTQTVTYEFEARANGCISPSTSTTDVTVIPLPEVILASNSPILCSSETTDIVLSSPTVGADIELIAVNTAPDVGSVTGITPLNTTWNSFPATIGDQLVNTTNVAQTVEYVFQVSVLGFNNPVTQSVFVEVRPIPNIAAITQGICSEDVTQVNILNPNNVSFTVFSWTTNNIGAVIGESDGTGNLISQQLINSSPLLDSIVYKIYATALSCAGDSIEVVQYVHPRNIANAGFDTTVCEGTPVINIESAFIGGSATDILWTNLDGDGVLSNTTSLVPSYTPASLPADEVGTINLQLTASDTSVCPAASDIVSLVINSKPVVNAGTDRIICETSSVNLNGSFAGAATGSTWSTSGDGTFSFVGDLNASYLPGTNDKSSGSATLTLITNDPIGPCLAATDDILIQVDAAATADAGSYAPTCIGDTIYLNGVIGGAAGSAMWSGGLGTFINPTQLNAAYVPASLEQGSDVMLSLMTDDPAGACFTETSQTLIAVNRLPLTNFEGLSASYQVDDATVILEGFPVGGVFSGTGIVASTFSPALADVGTHLVRYDFTGINGCSNYVEEITVVNALPVAEIGDPGPYCFNDDPINNPMPRTARSGFEDSWSGEHIFIKNGEYYFNHAVSGIGEFQVDYTIIETATGAVRTEPRNIRINDVPNINFSVLNNCIADTINFIDLSVLDYGDIFNDQIVQWEWRIGEGPDFMSTDQNPKIKFDTLKPGDYKVVLTATTKFNCTTSKTSSPGEIKIGAVPLPALLIRNQSFGMETQFTDNTTIPTTENILPDFVDPTSSIDSIWWDFGEASPIEGTYVNANIVYHQYSQGNTDFQVLMTIKTDLGCYATKSTYVSIIESISDFPYDEPFESYNPDANRGENSSWQLMVPDGNLIKGEAGNNAWITSDLNGRHNNSEHSYVMLPSFDLRSLERPMLSLDIWSNAENTRDGAIIQYIFDGEDWETLVDPNENISHDPNEQIGLNWYNEKGLISSPGNGIIESSIGSNLSGYGWTGVYSDWKTARFPLDELRDRQLAGASSVRFRVVFSSDQQNTVGTDYDGFAFDNLWIGDRERKILLEHFDNLENTQHRIDSINYWADVYAKDMIPLQYHNNYPGPDIIYQNNPFPTDTRGAIYDITQSPRSFMDGVMEYDYSGSYLKNYQVINRSLSSPKFDIDLVIEQDGDNKANIEATITARDTLDEQVTLYIMPVETGIYNSSEIALPAGIDSLNNVVKDMIPPGGREYNMHWVPGTSETFNAYWDMNELLSSNIIYDNTKLGVVVFVQNGENEIDKEIYQATYTRLPVLSNIIITGLEDELNAKKFETANIYPVPAQNYFNVALSDQLTIDVDWKIIDQRGIQMLDGNFGSGEDTFEVDTNSLPNGLYMFIVSGGSDIKYMRKLIIQR